MDRVNESLLRADTQQRWFDLDGAFVDLPAASCSDPCSKALVEYAVVLDVLLPRRESVPLARGAVPGPLPVDTAASVDYRLRGEDGSSHWVGSFSLSPIRGEKGGIVGAAITARQLEQLEPVPIGPEVPRAELQRLISTRDRAQEDERRRIARELHDDLQQSLAAIRLDAGALTELLPDASRPVSALLARVSQLAAAALVSVRRIVNDLRPELLEDLGLSTALQVLTRQFSERTQIVCRLEAQADATQALQSAPLMETSLFRIVQESLNNVAKHAQARHVDVRLDLDARGAVRLSIRDDGCGMPEDDPRKPLSFGLLGMRERVQALGGTFRIDSAPGVGTTVTVVADIDASVGGASRPAGPRDHERLRGR